jgi:hypothetical protein
MINGSVMTGATWKCSATEELLNVELLLWELKMKDTKCVRCKLNFTSITVEIGNSLLIFILITAEVGNSLVIFASITAEVGNSLVIFASITADFGNS